MNKKFVYVVTGSNHLIKRIGCVGVSDTKEGAEEIVKKYKYMLDEYLITKHEVIPHAD